MHLTIIKLKQMFFLFFVRFTYIKFLIIKFLDLTQECQGFKHLYRGTNLDFISSSIEIYIFFGKKFYKKRNILK